MSVRYAIVLLFALAQLASAQFSPAFLQNASYWTRDKSEFDFYDAQFKRDGEMHSCELLMILTPEIVHQLTLATLPNPKDPDAVPVIRLNQIATVPRGLVVEQQSITMLWNARLGALIQLSFTGYDGTVGFSKNIWQTPAQDFEAGWNYLYTSGSDSWPQRTSSAKDPALFYEELPLRVRMFDFSKKSGEAEVQLAPTVASAAKQPAEFKPAKISWKAGERDISVDVTHDGGKDHFVLDRDFPYLLREWQMADGSRLKMKNSLRVDYRNYLKNGDRERALKDPMLRHPD